MPVSGEREAVLYVPGLCGREDQRTAFRAAVQGLELPHWEMLAGRGRQEQGGRHGGLRAEFYAGLWQCLGLEPLPEGGGPLAAYALWGLRGERPEGCWLRADPVCLEADRDRLVMRAVPELDAEECAALEQAFAAHLRAEGLHLEAAGGAWYLQAGEHQEWHASPVHQSLGEDLHPHLPRGPHGRRWRRLLNEVQMLLHEHEINQERRRRGAQPANSLWFWGVGALPAAAPAPRSWSAVWTVDAVTRGLARAGGFPARTLPEHGEAWLAAGPAPGRHLLVWEGLRSGLWAAARSGDVERWSALLAEWESRWLGPLCAALGAGHLTGLAVCDERGSCWRLQRRDLRRWWRRRRPFHESL